MRGLVPVEPVATDDGLSLPLRRAAVSRPKGSALLLHGGTAGSTTFETPAGGGLVAYLNAEGVDVWTLDWRGGNLVGGTQTGPRPGPPVEFSISASAALDVPPTVKRIRETMTREGRGGQPLGVLGHCLGGGVIAASVAEGHLTGPLAIDRLVLSALGLFYASPWDGAVKVQDFIIEQVCSANPRSATIDTGVPSRFPAPMDASYAAWPQALRFRCGSEICAELSFMFGHPFLEENLADGIHDDAHLVGLFNHMPMEMYLHCGQNLRRGFYARFDETEDQVRCPAPDPTHFTMPVTLATGERNMLWHRDAIDRMHEWLRSNRVTRVTKHVFRGYAHQDLFWGRSSAKDVFGVFCAGLG